MMTPTGIGRRFLLGALCILVANSSPIVAQDFRASEEALQRDLETLCQLGPRVVGSVAFASALAYAETELRRSGLDAQRQAMEVHAWDPGRTPVRLIGIEGAGPTFELTTLGRSPALLVGEFELLDLGWGRVQELEANALRIPGRIVLIREGWPQGSPPLHRIQKLFLASDSGATAVIFHHPDGVDFRGTVAWPAEARIAALSLEDGRGLQEALAAGQRLRLEGLREGAVPPGMVAVSSANLLAKRVGSGAPLAPLLLSAHLDSWDLGEGALDNAAGVAVLLETARILSNRSWHGRRSLQFAIFTGEELGLEGSQGYLEACTDGRYELPAVVLNLEMPEAPSGYVIHSGAELRPLLAPLLLAHRGLGLEGGVVESLELYSDHMPFLLAGVPSMGLSYHRSEAADRRIHTELDRRSPEQASALARCAELVAATLWALSDPLAPLPDRLDEGELRSHFAEKGRDLERARRRGY